MLAHRLPRLPARLTEPYAETLAALPAIVVTILRPRNPCGCLGHYHPRGTESRLARRLSGDLGSYAGEIDLAYESIRRWDPRPISSLAVRAMSGELRALRFEAALLAVLLHELQHVAFPERGEGAIRSTSNDFYTQLMQELVARESGAVFGMNRPR